MNHLTAAELLFAQEQARTSIAGVRFLNHCANETADTQFKQLCQEFAQEKQAEVQRWTSLVIGTGNPSTITQ